MLQDAISILGVIGVFLTIFGVWLAKRQIDRTVTASQAAMLALNESREQYNRNLFEYTSRLLSESNIFASKEDWLQASMRHGDMANLLMQVAGCDPSWAELSKRLGDMESAFQLIQRGESKFSKSFQSKLKLLHRELKERLAEQLKPFNYEPNDAIGK